MQSEIATYRLATGEVTTVLTTKMLVEAPNWTPDGGSLIINGNGKLYQVNLALPHMVEINTGFAKACNNDHGISPDGRLLVISDQTEYGQSCIYTLPTSGGRPRLVQATPPSYWHGWSPDGSTLAYVAKRSETFQVFTCPVGGGEEYQVTHDFDHCDGPDYTPDGQWIWFNGQIGGSTQLWRIHPDGTGQQQMTSSEQANWFPHPSPDGKHILFLAFPSGTAGHPRDHDVELRLLPADGDHDRLLLELFGGQGTINVPCWAPDSASFAFARYRKG